MAAVIAARDQRRHQGLTGLAGRLAEADPADTDPADTDHAVRVLMALTSFETFDTLAGPDQDITAAVPDVLRLAEAALRPADQGLAD